MLKAIIVDDEAPARSELRFLLEETKLVFVVAEAANVHKAVEELHDNGADVMFLDIQMPEASGLQLANALGRLKSPPAIVFVTAYPEHGTRAFDVNAIDYLVKPVAPDRLLKAIMKVSNSMVITTKKNQEEHIAVEKGGKRVMLPIEDINYIMSRDDYSYIFTADDRYLTTVSLVNLEVKLEPFGFFRAHRRYLVNLSAINEVTHLNGGTLRLTIKGDDTAAIPVSRRRVPAIKLALNL